MKKIKYIIALALVSLTVAFTSIYANTGEFDIKINGNPFTVPSDMGAVHIKENRTMVPVRAFTEKLGWSVLWDSESNTITIPYNNSNIIMKINQTSYTNEKNQTLNLDVAPYIKDNRTYLPLRALTEALGYKLDYDDSTSVHKISIDSIDKSAYTIMLYINGSDLESNGGTATESIEEIIVANTKDSINIIVETGGASSWKYSGISSSVNQRHLIKNGTLKTIEPDLGARNMGESSTLSDFINYSVENYPADKYALIFWSHGFGSIRGLGYDELFQNDGLTLPEIKQSLADTDIKYEFIGFDACLMATIEMAGILKDYTNYLIASEDFVSSGSWDYISWILALNSNPKMSAKDLSTLIVDSYIKKYKAVEPIIALIDLTQIDAVNIQLSEFSNKLIEVIETWDFKVIVDSRYRTLAFGDTGVKGGPVDIVDIAYMSRTFGESIVANTEELEAVAKKAVYPQSPYEDEGKVNGLSIYFPYKNMPEIENSMAVYRQIGFNSDYMRFLDIYIQKLTEYNSQFIHEDKPVQPPANQS